MIHVFVIRHANRSFETPKENESSHEERENLTNNLEAGVVVLDCEKYQLLYANKAADCFIRQQDECNNSFKMVLTFDDGRSEQILNTE